MSGPGFIHLHIHSAFSLLEGALKLGTLLDLAKADKQPALGIADTNNLFGALEFSEKAAGKGIQPLVGAELTLDFEAAAERVMERNPDRNQYGKGGVVLIADERDRLRQSVAAGQQGLSRGRDGQGVGTAGVARPRQCRGHHLSDRRARGRHRSLSSPPGWTPRPSSAWKRCASCSATASISSCSAMGGSRSSSTRRG